MKKILLVLVAAMFVFSCNMGSDSGNVSKDEAKKENSSSYSGRGYSIESGYLKYKMMENNIEVFNTLYFRDYGDETAMLTEMDMMGQKLENYMLLKDGYMYMYNSMKKEGIKAKFDKEKEDSFKGFNVTEETVEKEGGKKIGTEKLLGKECVVYEVPDKANPKETTKIWVWKGLPVKVVDTEKVVMEAVELGETSNFPEGIFEVPEDIKFVETPDMLGNPSDKAKGSDFDEEGAKG